MSSKTRPGVVALSQAAEALRAHVAATGDSISAQISGADLYWNLTRSGLPLRSRDVRELKCAGVIVPFGDQIDPEGPAACYVLSSDNPAAKPVNRKKIACEAGAETIAACNAGLCLACAPREMCERIRAGTQAVPSNWIGDLP